MDLPPPRENRRSTAKDDGGPPRKKSPYVRFIAIGLGVTMIAIGLLMVLWGFSWMAAPDPDPLDDTSGLTGGPAILLVGVLFLGFGGTWIYMGYNDFPRREELDRMKGCPACNRRIEADLDFCYYCGEHFARDERRRKKDIEPDLPVRKKGAP